MVSILANSLGKAFLTSNNKLLRAASKEVSAVNKTGAAITNGSKVWVNPNGSSYDLIDFYSKIENFTTSGSPTINSTTGVATNFSTSDYININALNTFAQLAHNSAWEVNAKINMTTINTWNPIFGGSGGSWLPDLYVNDNNVLAMNLSSDGSSYNITGDGWSGTNTLSANTDYWVRFGWTGSEYYADLSTDGINYTREITQSSTTPVYGSSYQQTIGFRIGGYFQGSIYLRDTYILINGSQWWSPYFTGVDKTTKTGVAKEAIANGSSGLVEIMI